MPAADRVQQMLDECLASVSQVHKAVNSTHDTLATRLRALEGRYNDLSVKVGRPGGGDPANDNRAQAIGL